MAIYYIGNDYPEKRCVINKVSDGTYIPLGPVAERYSLKCFIEKVQHAFAHRYSRSIGEKTLSSYWFVRRSGVIHTFNSCISGKNKWCATFETILPRTNFTRAKLISGQIADKRTVKQFKLLAGDNCLGCMALSEATYKLQIRALDALGEVLSEKERERIKHKIKVIHPPQDLMVSLEEIEEKYANMDSLQFLFVGNDFFRKGGKELVDCLIELKKEYNFHLTVVSSMNYNDYASHATYDEMMYYKEILLNTEWITFFENLPNKDVLSLCRDSHVGLLPTFADTYGYSVLEMQASGCPVLSTDIRALPEINNEQCGWICHLEQNEDGEALYQTESERIAMKKQLQGQLGIQLKNILASDTGILYDKAINSWKRIEKEHNPLCYSEKLKKIMHE